MHQNLNEGGRPFDADRTIAHLGGRELRGALVYTGTRRVEHSDTEVRLYVNGKPGWCYIVSITLSAADLYDIELWGLCGRTKRSLGKQANLYGDELQHAVEQLYDRVMNETNDGIIPLH